MSGWKTYLGAALVAAAAGLEAMGYGEIAKVLVMVGGAVGIGGLRHAVSKSDK